MPPNLGGFFMVRSYYPSECHADYFDFERIEALKPAIEACGISTLSQSPMLGCHKQMDNRSKRLEEMLSFRMQGVEFDNGDMYVDGHKAASRSEEQFSRNAETELVCRLLLEKKKPHSLLLDVLFFFFKGYGVHRYLHSFPTRRSSDLALSSIMVICMLTAIRLL